MARNGCKTYKEFYTLIGLLIAKEGNITGARFNGLVNLTWDNGEVSLFPEPWL